MFRFWFAVGAMFAPLGAVLIMLVVAAAEPLGHMWRELRAARPGCCNACGYNLSHDPFGPCPECGWHELWR